MNVIKFLTKHNYIFEVKETDNGCVFSMPERLLDYYLPPDVRQYQVVQNENQSGVKITSLLDGEQYVSVPNYAIQLSIIADILFYSNIYDYNWKCIKFVDKDGKIVTDTQLKNKIKLNEREQDLQKLLSDFFLKQVEDGFIENVDDEAKLLGIGEGFDIVKQIYMSEESNGEREQRS